MSFTLFNPSRLKSCMLIKYSAQEPLRLGFRPSLSHKFSSLRDEVTLNDGRKGWIHEKKGGWFTIAVPSNNGQEQFVKTRKGEFQIIPRVVQVSAPTVKLETKTEVPASPFTLTHTPTPEMHSKFSQWIIFSDLHVKGSSIEACEEVLAAVHAAALEKNAGILFLGDFWHVRGSLNVELLNRVLKALRKWTQPVIMIPGNHDQVTLGGAVHALEPLLYAFRPGQILMLSEPTVCMGALWIPYRRDTVLMKSILAAGAADPSVSMIFCHADVKGAFMNDGMRSREGLDISMFPPNLPIYSGHFHKPHTMTKNNSSLRYVGSPYQTSLSEAGQDKFLYCMSCMPEQSSSNNNSSNSTSSNRLVWKEDSRWTISIGKKYIKATSAQDSSVLTAQKGDRVVIPVRTGEDYEVELLSSKLRERGVEVELRHERLSMPSIAGAITDAAAASTAGATAVQGNGSELYAVKVDEMDPLRIFTDYMSSIKISELMDNSSVAESFAGGKGKKQSPVDVSNSSTAAVNSDVARLALHSAVVEEGRSTIERLLSSSNHSSVSSDAHGTRLYNLRLDRLRLHNFGPYGGDPVLYPLSKRGLVLIKGQSTDGTGADSNGSGKTTLAMSVMWALSGSLDARLVADGRAADVAYDSGAFSGKGGKTESRTAEVSLWGTINEKSFEIVRRRSAKKSELYFSVDGKNLTTQSVKDTQEVIDEELGIGNGLLQRCCFFGQHSHTLQSLLGLTDVKLKNELSAVVSTDIWERAVKDVKERDKVDSKAASDLAVEARLRGEEAEKIKRSVQESLSAVRLLESQLGEAEQSVSQELGRSHSLTQQLAGGESLTDMINRSTELVSRIVCNKEQVIEPLRKEILQEAMNKTSLLSTFDKPLAQLREKAAQLRSRTNSSQASLSGTQSKLSQLTAQLTNVTTLIGQQLLAVNNVSAIAAASASLGASPLKILTAEEVNPDLMRRDHEETLSQLTSVDVRLKAQNKSLSNILELKANVTTLATADQQQCSVHGQDQCPTCGQDMPAGTRDAREAELRQVVDALLKEKQNLTQLGDFYRRRYDAGLKVKSLLDQQKTAQDRVADLRGELTKLVESIGGDKRELAECESEVAKKQLERVECEKELNRIHQEKTQRLSQVNAETVRLEAEEAALRQKIEEYRQSEALSLSTQGSVNATVVALQNRLFSARESLKERTNQQLEVDSALRAVEEKRKAISDRSAVMERLAVVLGPRGIQNYVFQGVLRQIESIANSYLLVLAEGGIQLTLQGEEDQDKIVKSVQIRAADGVFRERGLSQLSGGQWRRVSMALDLAFAEVIRRKGILRSNLIVMDEILNHLDSSGREAVGTVLRAMVEGPRPDDTASSEAAVADAVAAEDRGSGSNRPLMPLSSEVSSLLLGGGAYETVLIILQDLAAVELEEAFDHIDTVVKLADTAQVVVDGGN